MPYIKQESKDVLKPVTLAIAGACVSTEGELNYLLTTVAWKYMTDRGISYSALNAAIGALECAKLELYRRVAAKYEDMKMAENGDVLHS
jgi:hypothetical protein